MTEQTIKITNSTGLHARPAAQFVKVASQFQSSVELIKDEIVVNGKSILGVLSLTAERGSTLVLRITGEDEQKAAESLYKLLLKILNDEEENNK
jgi:phosphocarrier protein